MRLHIHFYYDVVVGFQDLSMTMLLQILDIHIRRLKDCKSVRRAMPDMVAEFVFAVVVYYYCCYIGSVKRVIWCDSSGLH